MKKQEISVPRSSRLVHLREALQPDATHVSIYSIASNSAEDSARPSVVAPGRADFRIMLRSVTFDPLLDLPSVPSGLRSGPGNELYLVQYWTVPIQEYKDRIEELGGKVYRFLPEQTQIVRMAAPSAERIARLTSVRWVGALHPAYRLDGKILAAYARGLDGVEGAREGRGEFDTRNEYSIEVFERAGGGSVTEPSVERGDDGGAFSGLAPVDGVRGTDLGQQGVVKAAIEAMGGRVSVVTPGGFRMQATLTMGQLVRVAHRNEVCFIEPWGYGGTDRFAP